MHVDVDVNHRCIAAPALLILTGSSSLNYMQDVTDGTSCAHSTFTTTHCAWPVQRRNNGFWAHAPPQCLCSWPDYRSCRSALWASTPRALEPLVSLMPHFTRSILRNHNPNPPARHISVGANPMQHQHHSHNTCRQNQKKVAQWLTSAL
jgi:hypothetical protein